MPSFKFLHWEERKRSTIEYDDGENCTLILVVICEHTLTQMTAVPALILCSQVLVKVNMENH